MKFLLIIMFISSASLMYCDKKQFVIANQPNIIGKWKLTETLMDIGDGKGNWVKSGANENNYIKFNTNNTVNTNLYLQVKDYIIIDPSHLEFTMIDNSKIKYRFTVTESSLELNPPCIEACGSRFEKVAD